MLKFLVLNVAGCLRKNVREFHWTAKRLMPQLYKLSPTNVDAVLRENEFAYRFPIESPVRSYDSNQLGSNMPCEDFHTEATFLHREGFVCGIFDGHGGPHCSRVISRRLLSYISAGTMQRPVLLEHMKQDYTSNSFLNWLSIGPDIPTELNLLYEDRFQKYITQLSSQPQLNVADELRESFVQLDKDLGQEALDKQDVRTMNVALAGAVVCLAHIEGRQLHVVSTGDCGAVLGTLDPQTKQWQSKKLNVEHNAKNVEEVQRILGEHPQEEHEKIIGNKRLLSQLQPLRAFGDYNYKWPVETLQKEVFPIYEEDFMPPEYHTPPYLTARPDIQHHQLDVNDKFLVIASDGLWDFLPPADVVKLVGDFISAKDDEDKSKVKEVKTMKDMINQVDQTVDQNAATHLIRHALGTTNSKISYYLTLPINLVRKYRDDITITVLFFNSEHIAKLKQAGGDTK